MWCSFAEVLSAFGDGRQCWVEETDAICAIRPAACEQARQQHPGR
jgi:hypothetical protein